MVSIRNPEDWLRKAQEIARLGNWDQDPKTGELWWSDQTYLLFGLDPQGQKMTFDTFLSYVNEEDRQRIKKTTELALSSDHHPYKIEYRITLPGQPERFVYEEAQVERDSDGQAIKIIGIIQDITERKTIENQLRQRESELKEAQKIAKIGSWELNLIKNELSWSDEVYRIFDLTPQQFPATYEGFLENIHPEDRDYVNQAYTQSVENKQPYNIIHRLLMSDGTLKYVNERCKTFFDEEGNAIRSIGTVQDITDSVLEEQQRHELEDQLRLKHKMEAVGYMAGGMAHNFNNNLSIILGNIELSQIKATNSEIIPLLENAKIAVRRSRDLVLKIITYSRKGIRNLTFIHLTDVINETVALLLSTLPTTVNLQQEINPESRSNVIHADPSQIQEVLINLCNNAVHAMNEQGDLKILLDTVELIEKNIPAQYEAVPGAYAKLSIQDTGCGMPAEMLDKIFDPFYSTKEEYEGAGMGLATVQGIVAQHGGIIIVNSIPGQGSVFNLYFPIVEEAATEPKNINTDMPKGTEKILFIDDDEILANLGEKLLSEQGYQVSSMTESPEALKLFAANADYFDMVITDQTMPQLSGKELIQELKKIRPDLRTILCTGFSNQINEDQARQQGIDAFCMKPLDLPELLQAVRRVLDGDKEK